MILKIDTLQGERYNLAIELLIQRKDSLVYNKVVLYWEKVWDIKRKKLTDREILIISTSSDYSLENTTVTMAKEKIAYSKIILNELIAKSRMLRKELVGLDIIYKFGIDYGNGGFDLAIEENAIEENNNFQWLKD